MIDLPSESRRMLAHCSTCTAHSADLENRVSINMTASSYFSYLRSSR